MHPEVTNALVDIPHVVRRHDSFARPIRSPTDFAAALNYDPARITKSLFLRATSGHYGFALAVAPAAPKIDFKAVARYLGWPRMEVAPRSDLEHVLGYAPTGVTPLGVPATITVIVDEQLLSQETILVGGGVPGVEVEIAPATLVAVTHATVAPISKTE